MASLTLCPGRRLVRRWRGTQKVLLLMGTMLLLYGAFTNSIEEVDSYQTALPGALGKPPGRRGGVNGTVNKFSEALKNDSESRHVHTTSRNARGPSTLAQVQEKTGGGENRGPLVRERLQKERNHEKLKGFMRGQPHIFDGLDREGNWNKERRDRKDMDECPGVVYRQGQGSNVWQTVSNISHIFSAYMDFRQTKPSVRIVGLQALWTPPRWCHLFYKGSNVPEVSRLQAHLNQEHHGKPMGAAEYICPLPPPGRRPCGVTVSGERNDTLRGFVPVVSGRDSGLPVVNFTACIPPVYLFDDPVHLVENLELKRMFGASRFVVYVTSLSMDVMHYLKVYAALGVVDLVQWTLPVAAESVHYNAQLAALTDCMLRAMDSTQFVAYSDLDEVIVPMTTSGWADMLAAASLDAGSAGHGAASFCFRNSFVSLKCPDADMSALAGHADDDQNGNGMAIGRVGENDANGKDRDAIDDRVENDEAIRVDVGPAAMATTWDIWSLKRTRRAQPPLRQGHYSKCIVDPRGVDLMGIHFAWRLTSGRRAANVSPSIGLLWHYRVGVPCSSTNHEDRRMHEWAREISRRISNMHRAASIRVEI